MDRKVLSLLGCPNCHGALEEHPHGLICRRCGVRFPVIDGIPVLIPGSAKAVDERTEK
ncbi:Trm112 family protein [Acidipila rosea]|uniref:Uncharacterized protein n=1 Tax=Acidipila rosea TaxID=768535 RepID=A0A4R1L8K1_9BACT|nr:Trm112 family protein [Acidipila rosea]MBW4026363.1 Trm112 family protein [Acidobacteriota bacterium]MBW4044501.1 Trm112 family protein [Acidobacteriota bacterium]TCK72679.1 hypothetical protein C7378_2267 [Acidipila rosea]